MIHTFFWSSEWRAVQTIGRRNGSPDKESPDKDMAAKSPEAAAESLRMWSRRRNAGKSCLGMALQRGQEQCSSLQVWHSRGWAVTRTESRTNLWRTRFLALCS